MEFIKIQKSQGVEEAKKAEFPCVVSKAIQYSNRLPRKEDKGR